jgi:WD40 repeat protein
VKQADIARQQTSIAQQQTKRAQQQTNRANLEKRIANLRTQAAQAVLLSEKAPVEALIRGIVISTEAKNLGLNSIGINTLSIALSRTEGWGEIDRLVGHASTLTALVFSHDGQSIFSGAGNGSFGAWSVKTGKPFLSPQADALDGATGFPLSLSLQPDSNCLAWVDGYHEYVFTREIARGGCRGNLSGPNIGRLTSLAFSHDGRYMTVASDEGGLSVWSSIQRHIKASATKAHKERTTSVAVSSDGLTVFSASWDRSVKFWKIHGSRMRGQTLYNHADLVSSIALSPNERYLVSASNDKTLLIWDILKSSFATPPLRGHSKGVEVGIFSPSGTEVISGSADGTLRIWDAAKGIEVADPLRGHMSGITTIAISPTGHTIASGSADGTLRLWERHKRHDGGQQIESSGLGGRLLAINYDQGEIITSGQDGRILYRSVSTGRVIRVLPRVLPEVYSAIAISASGRVVAIGFSDGTVRIQNLERSGKISWARKSHMGSITTLAFSPDSRQIAIGSDDNMLITRDIRNGDQIARFGRPLGEYQCQIRSIAYSPTGNKLAFRYCNESIVILDTPSLVSKVTVGNGSIVRDILFSPDGHNLVSASGRELLLWDVSTGRLIGEPLIGHAGEVLSLAYSPNGHQIVSASDDSTLRFWDAQSGQPIGMPLSTINGLNSIAFSPSGDRVFASSIQGNLSAWDATGASDLIIACQHLGRHQLLLRSEKYNVSSEFEAIAHRARAICANPPVPPPLTGLAAPTSVSKASSQTSLRLPVDLQFITQAVHQVKRLLRF